MIDERGEVERLRDTLRYHDQVRSGHSERILYLESQVRAFEQAISRGGFDLAPCSVCGETVVCVPEGGVLCVECAEKEQ